MLKKLKPILLVSLLISCISINLCYADKKAHYNGISDYAKEPIAALQEIDVFPDKLKEVNFVNYTLGINREEFGEILIKYYLKATNQNLKATKITFTDTKNEYIQLGGELGILKGFDKNEFIGWRSLTREDVSIMLARCEKIINPNFETTTENNFTDKNKISPWALEGVSTMSKKEIVNGYPSGFFKPKKSMTKEEALIVIARMAKQHNLVNFKETQKFEQRVIEPPFKPEEAVLKNYPDLPVLDWIRNFSNNGVVVVNTTAPNMKLGEEVIKNIEITGDDTWNIPVTTLTIYFGEGESRHDVEVLLKNGHYQMLVSTPSYTKDKSIYQGNFKTTDVKAVFITDLYEEKVMIIEVGN